MWGSSLEGKTGKLLNQNKFDSIFKKTIDPKSTENEYDPKTNQWYSIFSISLAVYSRCPLDIHAYAIAYACIDTYMHRGVSWIHGMAKYSLHLTVNIDGISIWIFPMDNLYLLNSGHQRKFVVLIHKSCCVQVSMGKKVARGEPD